MKLTRQACGIVLAILPLLSLAGENPSALNALKLLPKEEVKNLARIEAYDGTPVPERWHILVYDPNASSGVREYVIAGGELVVSRGVSQFAESLKTDDVIENSTLRIDSDKLARLAEDYAAANNASVSSISYQLLRKERETEPVWQVNCLDGNGQKLGTVIVTAASGIIVSHPGFTSEPRIAANHTGPLTVADWERDTDQDSRESRTRRRDTDGESASTASGPSRKKSTTVAAKRSNEKRKVASRPSSRSRVRAQPAEVAPPPVFLERRRNPIGSALRRMFRF